MSVFYLLFAFIIISTVISVLRNGSRGNSYRRGTDESGGYMDPSMHTTMNDMNFNGILVPNHQHTIAVRTKAILNMLQIQLFAF